MIRESILSNYEILGFYLAKTDVFMKSDVIFKKSTGFAMNSCYS